MTLQVQLYKRRITFCTHLCAASWNTTQIAKRARPTQGTRDSGLIYCQLPPQSILTMVLLCTSTSSGSALECLCPIELLELFPVHWSFYFYGFKIKSRLSCNCFLYSQWQTVNWEAKVPYIDKTHGIIYIYINSRHNGITSYREEYLGFANSKQIRL